jgi:malate/lactate dehydrogenase
MLQRSADEILVWVDETRRARGTGQDLDHAAAMVAQRVRHRYAALSDDADGADAVRLQMLAGTSANVAGIMRWLEKSEPAGSGSV